MGGASPDATRELDTAARARVRWAGLVAGALAAILILLLGAGPRQAMTDAFQTLIPGPDISRRVHVVVLDAESLREVGGWPWSRFYLARLIEAISERGAVAIGLDMLLEEHDRNDPQQFLSLYGELAPPAAGAVRELPSMDAVLADVLAREPVVVARAGVRRGSFDFMEPTAEQPKVAARFAGTAPDALLDFPAIVTNLPVLDAAARGHGLVNGDHDPDGIVRRVPLVARAKGTLTPGFALEMARVASGAREIRLIGGRHLSAVEVGAWRVPATADGQLMLRFGDWRRTPTTSAVNLLRKGLPGDLFKGQIVLIGLTSAGASDVVATPRSGAVSGVFVQAQAVDAILRGAGLQRPAWTGFLEWALGLFVAVMTWLAVPHMPIWRVAAVGLASVAAALTGSAIGFAQGLVVDPLPMLGPGAAVTAATMVMLYLEGRRLQERLRGALELQRTEAELRQQLLINELNHRVKNTLATVQSMASQSLRPDRTPAEAREAFVSRLIALSTAQNLLTAEGWESAEIGDVVRQALAPFEEDGPGGRFLIDGPPARLGPQPALALAMAVHELAVNAAKFGALSVEAGQVDVKWRRDGDQMTFAWIERRGPPVTPPTRRGFGTRLIQDGLARELRGKAVIEHRPEGLRFAIVFPAPA